MTDKTITDKIITSLPNIKNLWYGHETNNINKLGNQEVLKIGNALEGILNNMDSKINIDIPRLVVVGTQSSGKSSLLNNIISMDIMPTGKTMVTRVPLNIQLNQSSKLSQAEFGDYKNGNWIVEKTINLTLPEPLENEIEAIHKEIENQTNLKAGNSQNICTEAIILKIYSPNVPNLGLIDLPGIVMVACTDKGQPKDIKNQIRNMIGNYIKSDRSIILAVVPARPDIEADPALELIKEYDPNGKRTVGVLTKIDLMNNDSDIVDYLNNSNISKDLQFNYGYYAVKNRSSNDISILEGIKNEKFYFSNHDIYKNLICQERLGSYNLSNDLSKILVNHIRKNIPLLISEVTKNLKTINDNLLTIGPSLPENDEGKMSLLYSLISQFCSNFSKAINNRGDSLNTGRVIKESLIKYRDSINNLNPFTNQNYDDNSIQDMIENYFGIHMSYNIIPIEIMENCLKNDQNNPYNLLIEPSITCINSIKNILFELVNTLLKSDSFKRFPKLDQKIRDDINTIIQKYINIAENKLKEHINIEKNYIWTEDKLFLQNLQELVKKTNLQNIETNTIRLLLNNYFETVKISMANIMPKIIMYFSIKNIEKEITNNLFNQLSKSNISDILKETPLIEEKRQHLLSNKNKLESAKKIILDL